MPQKLMIVDMDACSGCQSCIVACSMAKAKTFSPSKSRILIKKDESRCLGIPVVCEHCDHPPCKSACPTGAISKDSQSGLVSVDPSACTGCERCRWACPFGPDTIRMIDGVATICDLCGGKPMCVRVCQQGAIVYMPTSKPGVEKKWERAEKRARALASLTVKGVA